MPIAYRLVRSQRRTLALVIERDGALVVRAPLWTPLRDIEAVIAQREGWIAKKQANARDRTAAIAPLTLCEGAALPYLGGFLHVGFGALPFAIDYHGQLLLPRHGKPVAHARAWRKRRAQEELGPRIAYWAEITGLMPSSVAYSEARMRWGSMNRKRGLRLNTALVHCSQEVIDYTIVHELAHIVHFDHSPAFYEQMARWLPDERALRDKMKLAAPYLELLRSPPPVEER